MSESWEFYFTEVEGRPASIAVDLAAALDGPDLERQWLVAVRVAMQNPRPDGLSSEAEAPRLNEIEDAVVAALGARCAARIVGRLTWFGRRELFLYGRDADGLEDALRAIAARFPDRELASHAEHDPEWTRYEEFLYPARDELQWILDRKVVDQLVSAGDALLEPRPVDHHAFFDDPASRDAFMADAGGRGFTCETADRKDGDGGGYGAHLVRTDAVNLEHIHEVVLGLVELATRHGGDYDGWGCPVRQRA